MSLLQPKPYRYTTNPKPYTPNRANARREEEEGHEVRHVPCQVRDQTVVTVGGLEEEEEEAAEEQAEEVLRDRAAVQRLPGT